MNDSQEITTARAPAASGNINYLASVTVLSDGCWFSAMMSLLLAAVRDTIPYIDGRLLEPNVLTACQWAYSTYTRATCSLGQTSFCRSSSSLYPPTVLCLREVTSMHRFYTGSLLTVVSVPVYQRAGVRAHARASQETSSRASLTVRKDGFKTQHPSRSDTTGLGGSRGVQVWSRLESGDDAFSHKVVSCNDSLLR